MSTASQSLARLGSLVGIAACAILSGCGGSQAAGPSQSADTAGKSATLGSDAEIEARIRQVPIKFYMASWCPVCRRAKAWLKKENYTFELLDVEQNEQAATYMMMVNPRGTIPMFEVDGMRVVGFSPDKLREVLKRAAKWRKKEQASR